MRTGIWKVVPVLSALAFAAMVAPYAHAGCGLYTPVTAVDARVQSQIDSSQAEPDAASSEDRGRGADPGIIGTWKQYLISEGNEGIPDGTEVDASYAQWHSDGTEMQVSGMRAPLTGDVCLGEWIKTGFRTYRLNHFGVSYDSTGQNLIGPARLQVWLTIDARGNATSGKFTLVQWDESGNVLASLKGKIVGTRVTMDTGFEKVE